MRRIAFLTLTILSITPLSAIACQNGHPDSLAYIRRDENRCEGLKDGQDVSLSFRLTSLVSRSLNSYPDTLTVKIPAPNNALLITLILKPLK